MSFDTWGMKDQGMEWFHTIWGLWALLCLGGVGELV